MLTILIPAAILGLIVLLVVSLRGRSGADFSPIGLLGLYLHLASLAGVLVFFVGAAALVNVGFAATAGNDFTYGRPPDISVAPCPPNTPECEAVRARSQAFDPLAQRDRRPTEDLVRGLTFSIFGALFWGAHWLARRNYGAASVALSFRRGYLMSGTLIFGLVTVVLLPWGAYQAFSTAILPPAPNQFNTGIADTLAGGIAALPIWLIYLRLVVRGVRSSATAGTDVPITS